MLRQLRPVHEMKIFLNRSVNKIHLAYLFLFLKSTDEAYYNLERFFFLLINQ